MDRAMPTGKAKLLTAKFAKNIRDDRQDDSNG